MSAEKGRGVNHTKGWRIGHDAVLGKRLGRADESTRNDLASDDSYRERTARCVPTIEVSGTLSVREEGEQNGIYCSLFPVAAFAENVRI